MTHINTVLTICRNGMNPVPRMPKVRVVLFLDTGGSLPVWFALSLCAWASRAALMHQYLTAIDDPSGVQGNPWYPVPIP